jgi:hypothetical protein
MRRKQKIDRSIGIVPLAVVTAELQVTIPEQGETISEDSTIKCQTSQISQPGVVLSGNGSNERLTVSFLDRQSKAFDFSEFLPRREIAIAFAEAFHANGLEQKQITRKKAKSNLRFFFTFLHDYETANPMMAPIVTLKQITTSLLNAYVTWLNDYESSDSELLKENTKSQRLGAVREVIRWLKQDRPREMAEDCDLPYNRWSGRARRTQPRAVLSKPDQQALERACLQEIEEIWADFEYGRELIEKSLFHLAPIGQPIDLNDLGNCLAYIEHRYEGFIPLLGNFLLRSDPKLYRAIRRHGGREQVSKYFFPSIRRLTPFILFITSRTFGNIDSILLINRDCIRDHPVLTSRKTVEWFKGRANALQKRSYPTTGNQNTSVLLMIERVLKLTMRLVSKVDNRDYSNRLFLYSTRSGYVNSFDGSGSENDTFARALTDFRHKYGLAKFSPSNLRATGSDRTDEVMGGDIKARQIALNHKSAQTTKDHYTSDGIRQRYSKRIATLQGKLFDWIRTKGKLDPRVIANGIKDLAFEQVETMANGKTATTAGFVCKNPLNSPQDGESKGKLCSSWLGCFSCDNAIIIRDAETLARLLQLESQLIDARSKLNVLRFTLFYEPKLKIIQDDLLPLFVDSVVYSDAKKILETLISLPDLE